MQLKIHIGGNGVQPGAGAGFHLLSQRACQLGSALNGAQTLAVGRVRQHDGLRLCGKGGNIRHLKVAAVLHTRQLGVGVGLCHGGGVDIVAVSFKAHVQLGLCQCLLALLCPQGSGHKAVALGGKAAFQTRGNVHGLLRGFDQQGAAAAEGVLHQAVAAHTAKVGDGRRQRLAQRGFHGVAAVAALVQTLAGGVQHDLAHIFAQHKAHLVLHAALGQHGGAVTLHQALDHRLFDDALAGGDAGQLAVQGRAGDREGGIRRQKLLPRDGIHAIEQLVKGGGLVACQQQHHALHGAQVEVCGGNHLCPAAEAQTAILHPDVLCANAGQLKFSGGFAPEKAGRDQFKFCGHGSSFLFCTEKTDLSDRGQACLCSL